MTVLQTLGVFEKIYGAGAEMTLSRAALISVVGILIVFLILSILAVFVKVMGFGFDRLHDKRRARMAAAAPAATTAPLPKKPVETGSPLPEDTSAGTLKLIDVTEEEAAVVMAVVSHRSGIPLNRLQFNSIKAVKDDGKETT